MESHLLIFGIWFRSVQGRGLEVFKEEKRETRRVPPHQTSTPKTKPRFQSSTTFLNWAMLIMSCRTRSFTELARCCTSLRIPKPWLKWSLKEGVPQWDMYPDPHRVALDWLCDRINLNPKIQVKCVNTKHQLADILDKKGMSHVISGTIFVICLTSDFSGYSAAFRISAWPAVPKRWRKGCKHRKEGIGSRQS